MLHLASWAIRSVDRDATKCLREIIWEELLRLLLRYVISTAEL